MYILYYTMYILYYTILYYTILYYTILYYTNTILYYTILYYTLLYYTILYFTILYYTILYVCICVYIATMYMIFALHVIKILRTCHIFGHACTGNLQSSRLKGLPKLAELKQIRCRLGPRPETPAAKLTRKPCARP